MNQGSSFPLAWPRTVARKSGPAAWLVGALLLALPASALADTVILPDPTATPEQSEIAGAVSLLVRSYLVTGQRDLAPRRELALAIEAVTGRTPGKNLTVSSDIAAKLIERMAADGLVMWEFQVGQKGTTVTGMLLGPGGKRQLRIVATAATGDIAGLAKQVATKLAPAIGATLGSTPEAGLAEVRPFLAAESAIISGDSASASRAVELVLPMVVGRLAEAKRILLALAEDPAVPALPRAQARLLRGEWGATVELTDAGLANDPKNAPLRAAKVRALAALKDFPAAETELAALRRSRNLSAVALAAVALAIERGDPVAKKDAALAPLAGRPAAEWRPLLPLIAATPPGSFGPRVEAEALAAAEKLAPQEPGLASTLAARALSAGGQARQAAPLIKIDELSAEQIKAISARLSAEAADSATTGLTQQLKAREDEAKAIAEEAGPEKPTGPPSTLAVNLRPLLQGFDGLYEPTLSAIQIAPLPGSGQPFYWPFLVREQHLAAGLLETLMRSPWELQATQAKIQTDALPPDRLTDEGIASLARDLGCSALLLYRIRPAGLAPWVKVEFILHDVARQRTDHIEASLIGRSTGLVILNPLVIALAVLAFLCALGWAVLISFRGTIAVRVQWDSDAKDELFSIRISRSPHTPTIENLTAYRKKLEWLGRRKRRFEAWNVEQNTVFRGIPRGNWYVHLYGIYTRGRQTMLLREPPQEVLVLPRKTTFVAHVLEAAEAEFKIVVIDDSGPVEGAHLWLDDQKTKAISSAKDGSVSFKVPKGYHVIRVSARGMTVERPYHVLKSKLHEMTINLVWERRQEYASRALERQVDDAAPYMTKSSRGSGTYAANLSPPATAAAVLGSTAMHQAPGSTGMPSATNGHREVKSPAGIEISLEDTPIVDLVSPLAAPRPPQSAPASPAKTAPRASAGRLTMSLKPLSPESSQAVPPATAPNPAPTSNRGKVSPPGAGGEDIVDLPMMMPPAADEPPVDLGAPLDLAAIGKTDPSLSPAPPKPSKRQPQ